MKRSVVQEKSKRRLDEYVPHSGAWRGAPNDGQRAFHQDSHRIRACLGSNQSGKTSAGIIESIWYALGIHPYKRIKIPNRGRIVASLGFEEGANQVIVPKLREYIPEGALKCPPKTNSLGVPSHWEFNNGSEFNILSGQQDKLVFEGWVGNWSWIDEPCSQDIYNATRRGLLKNEGDLWFTLTPLTEPWLFNDLYQPWVAGERDDMAFFRIDIWDNAVSNGGYIPDAAIKDFIKDLPEDEREARIHGNFRFLSGRIYPQYDPNIHVVKEFPIPKDWPVWEGIDPHLQKEHAYCQWAISPNDEIYVCKEIYEKVTIPELAMKIQQARKGKKIVCTLIDTSAETPDSISRMTPRRVLEQHGIRTRLAQKSGKLYHGIHLMRDLLTPKLTNLGDLRPRFFVFDSCKRHQKEFMNYVQDDRTTEYIIKDTPRKIWDDMMDLDRYFVIENPLMVKDVKPFKYNSFNYLGA